MNFAKYGDSCCTVRSKIWSWFLLLLFYKEKRWVQSSRNNIRHSLGILGTCSRRSPESPLFDLYNVSFTLTDSVYCSYVTSSCVWKPVLHLYEKKASLPFDAETLLALCLYSCLHVLFPPFQVQFLLIHPSYFMSSILNLWLSWRKSGSQFSVSKKKRERKGNSSECEMERWGDEPEALWRFSPR